MNPKLLSGNLVKFPDPQEVCLYARSGDASPVYVGRLLISAL